MGHPAYTLHGQMFKLPNGTNVTYTASKKLLSGGPNCLIEGVPREPSNDVWKLLSSSNVSKYHSVYEDKCNRGIFRIAAFLIPNEQVFLCNKTNELPTCFQLQIPIPGFQIPIS